MDDLDTGKNAADKYTVPALQRGMQLLGQFTRHEPALTGAELSRRLGLPRASVFRILQTLEQMGFVERVGEGPSYKLGIAVLRLGFEFLASMELAEHGRPIIDELSIATGMSAHIVVRDATEVVFVARAAQRNLVYSAIQVGARLPAHATVLGRILLADLDLAALERLYEGRTLEVFTPKTPTTLKALREQVLAEAARGYGISEGGFETNICTIAAPVFDDHHRVAAAINVTVPGPRVEPDALPLLVEQVQQAASRLTQCISHVTPRTVRFTAPAAAPALRRVAVDADAPVLAK
jgi:DNA-binding IclR family transcriptional regulator